MAKITLLTQDTIDKIAAGEVVERPSSVVKELVENAIDAGASAITIEIKDGGISFIRITDNGCGIDKEQVPLAFLRHSTSKIKSVEDLMCVRSLGFRGEALSSISAVARVELITKTYEDIIGTRYVIEGSKEITNEEVGAPEGTTFIIKDLFFNTPARRKFLKSAQTEGNYISDMVEKLALSHPNISFKFINNNKTRLHTSGNGNQKDLIYHIFGREIAASIIEVEHECEYFKVRGYIGKPIITRGNRNYENFFINGRYIKSQLISKAVETAYKNYLMQHQYPFVVLHFDFNTNDLDVNVHPTKIELRIENNNEVYRELAELIYSKLAYRELIPDVPVKDEPKSTSAAQKVYKESIPEPFEKRRINDVRNQNKNDYLKNNQKDIVDSKVSVVKEDNHFIPNTIIDEQKDKSDNKIVDKVDYDNVNTSVTIKNNSDNQIRNIEKTVDKSNDSTKNKPNHKPTQITLGNINKEFLSESSKKSHKIIGQLFDTYWLIEFEEKLFIIDQHAAHEKVLYEKTMATLKDKEFTSQTISPPIIISLDVHETEMLEKYRSQIERLGYVVEHFGGKEYMISALPDNLYHIDMKDLFIEMLDDFSNLTGRETPELILEKVASMSCKAAVKGNSKLSLPEIEALIDDLLALDNPYNCPHGRPTIISMSKYEIEKKFKRIV